VHAADDGENRSVAGTLVQRDSHGQAILLVATGGSGTRKDGNPASRTDIGELARHRIDLEHAQPIAIPLGDYGDIHGAISHLQAIGHIHVIGPVQLIDCL